METSELEKDAIRAAMWALGEAKASGTVSLSGGTGSGPETLMGAKEALERIARGETIENVIIDRLSFAGEFPGPVRFRGVTLHLPEFHGAVFRGEFSVLRSTIERPVFRGNNVFAADLVLGECTLVKAHFHNLSVAGRLQCFHTRAEGTLLFSDCKFVGSARWWEARLDSWLEFKRCEFRDATDFRGTEVQGGLVMQGCRFVGDALFAGMTVDKKWDAGTSRFEGLLDLSMAKLHDFVYLETIEQGIGQSFAFANVMAERILVKTEQLDGRLASENAGRFDEASQEYALLRRAFAEMHRYDQEDWAFYRLKLNRRRAVERSWNRPWTKIGEFLEWLVLDQGCGYCTNPLRAVRSAALIIFGFGLIYTLGIDHFYVDHRPFEDDPVEAFSNATMLGMLTSVSAFVSGLQGIKDVAKGWMNIPLIAESLMGTMLFGLFIVAFSRKVIR